MGKRGPKPKSTSLKVLEGVHPFRINQDEPKYPIAPTTPPVHFKDHALDLWNELIPILTNAHVFTIGDRVNLELLCTCYQRWRDNPDNKSAVDTFVRLSDRFGLNPSSRSSIKVSPTKPKDDLETYFEKKA